ncbi:MAG: hypothetical protein QGH39_03735 [Candidatus Thermoplasmatota archaeon]|nr:hypothetical protein [Candidatus Thermoplasmatota archaeon]
MEDYEAEKPGISRDRAGYEIIKILGICVAVLAIIILFSGNADAELNVTVGDRAPTHLGPSSDAVCMLNITANNNSQGATNFIDSINITVYNESGFGNITKLAALSGNANSGVSIYLESGETPEFQLDEDTLVGVPGQWYGNGPYWDVLISFSPNITVPNSSSDPLLYVIVRSSDEISNLDMFNVSIKTSAVNSANGTAPNAIAASSPITADTLAPTITGKVVDDTLLSYVYYDALEDIIYYGDDMTNSQALVVRLTGVADALSGVANVTFPGLLGNNGIVVNTAPYSFRYDIEDNDTDSGLYYVNVYDNVGNYLKVNLSFQRDVTAPYITGVDVIELSDFLYFEVDARILYYGNEMGQSQDFYVYMIAPDDDDSGLWGMRHPVNLGTGQDVKTNLPYNITFTVYSSDSSEEPLNFSIHDRVNNTYKWSMEILRDVTPPTAVLLINESSSYLHSSHNTLYYGANMDELQPFSLEVAGASDDLAGVWNTEFPGIFDQPSAFFGSQDVSYEYNVNRSNRISGKYEIVVRDLVFNSLTLSLNVVRDATIPSGFLDISEDSNYIFFDSGSKRLYYGNKMTRSQNFEIKIKMGDDSDSGFGGVIFPDFSGQNTSISSSPHSFNYEITLDTVYHGVLRISLFDNVGNTLDFEIELIPDITPPESGSINIGKDSEYLYYSSGDSILYYSPLAGTPAKFLVELINFDDPDSGIAHVRFPTLVNNSGVNITGYLRNDYTLSEEWGSDLDLTIIVFDLCGNSVSIVLHLIADSSPPSYGEFVLEEDAEAFYYEKSTGFLYISVLETDAKFSVNIFNISDELAGVKYVLIPPIEGITGGRKILQNDNFSEEFNLPYNEMLEGTYTFKIFDNVSNVLNIDLVLIVKYNLNAPAVETVKEENSTLIDENGNVSFSVYAIDSPFELELYYKIKGGAWTRLGKCRAGEIKNFTIKIFNSMELAQPGYSTTIELKVIDPLSNTATTSPILIQIPDVVEEPKEDEQILGSFVILVAFLILIIILFGSLFLWVLPHKGEPPKARELTKSNKDKERVEVKTKTPEIRSVELEDGEETDEEEPEEEDEEYECPDCGSALREEDNVCHSCGAEFEEEDEEEGGDEDEDFELDPDEEEDEDPEDDDSWNNDDFEDNGDFDLDMDEDEDYEYEEDDD